MNQEFFWKGKYKDGSEFNQNGYDEFNNIRKNEVESYTLYNINTDFSLTHFTKNGDIEVFSDNVLSIIRLKLNGYTLGITNDIISYRGACMGINTEMNEITYYYHGYKQKNDQFNYIEVLYCIDLLENKFSIKIKLNPKTEKVLKSILEFEVLGEQTLIHEFEFEKINHKYELPEIMLN